MLWFGIFDWQENYAPSKENNSEWMISGNNEIINFEVYQF